MLVPGLGAGCTTMTQGEPLPPAAPCLRGRQPHRGRTRTGTRVSSTDGLTLGSPSEWMEVRSGGERPWLSGCEVGGSQLAGERLHPPSGHCTEPTRGEGAGAHPIAQIYPPNIGFVLDTVNPGHSLRKPGWSGATGRDLGWNFKLGSLAHIKDD